MVPRILLILIATFWVTTNALLWNAEYGARPAIGSPVPVETVWQKILNAPDDSSLHIMRHGKRIGFCRLQTGVGEEFSKLEEAPQEGIKVKNRMHFDGYVMIEEKPFRRLRFDCDFSLSPKQAWERFNLRLMSRPFTIEFESVAAAQTLRIKESDRDGDFERTFKFSELQNPTVLLEEELGGPLAAGLLGGLDLSALAVQSPAQTSLLKWEARNDTLTIGHEPVRVYRLETRLADRYTMVIFVSRAGEILKAQLPEGIVLLHDKLSSF